MEIGAENKKERNLSLLSPLSHLDFARGSRKCGWSSTMRRNNGPKNISFGFPKFWMYGENDFEEAREEKSTEGWWLLVRSPLSIKAIFPRLSLSSYRLRKEKIHVRLNFSSNPEEKLPIDQSWSMLQRRAQRNVQSCSRKSSQLFILLNPTCQFWQTSYGTTLLPRLNFSALGTFT